MTADAFKAWLEAMRTAKLIETDADAARLLGVSRNALVTLKQRGGDRRTQLACLALLHRLG